MSESKRGHASQAKHEKSSSGSSKSLHKLSPKSPSLERNPLGWSNPVNMGFPYIGEEIQIDMGRGRMLVLKYNGTDKNDDLRFKWVGTIS